MCISQGCHKRAVTSLWTNSGKWQSVWTDIDCHSNNNKNRRQPNWLTARRTAHFCVNDTKQESWQLRALNSFVFCRHFLPIFQHTKRNVAWQLRWATRHLLVFISRCYYDAGLVRAVSSSGFAVIRSQLMSIQGNHIPLVLTLKNSTFCPHSVFKCFVWVWEQTAIISLNGINCLDFITEI